MKVALQWTFFSSNFLLRTFRIWKPIDSTFEMNLCHLFSNKKWTIFSAEKASLLFNFVLPILMKSHSTYYSNWTGVSKPGALKNRKWLHKKYSGDPWIRATMVRYMTFEKDCRCKYIRHAHQIDYYNFVFEFRYFYYSIQKHFKIEKFSPNIFTVFFFL